ncbi:MAG: hypothetical protein SGPRY_009021, partial [Prymnesium sp.]
WHLQGMTSDISERAFARVEGEEEVTPPYSCRTRSFESLVAAKVLADAISKNDALIPPPSPRAISPPSSPSRAAAAAGLLDVQRIPTEATDSVVDCLMSLSSQPAPDAPPLAESKKRPYPEQQLAARRKLKLRSTESCARLAVPGDSTSSASSPPLRLLSGASIEQLKLLAAAFKLCPSPTPQQILAIAERVAITPEALCVWFQSRKVLQDWVQQQPHISINDLKNMFYCSPGIPEA